MHGGSHGVTLASQCYAVCHSTTTPAPIAPAGHPREYLPHRHPRRPLLRRQQPCAHRPLHLPGRLPPMLLQQGAHCGLLAGQCRHAGQGQAWATSCCGLLQQSPAQNRSNSSMGSSSSAPRTGRIPEAERVLSWNPATMLPCEPGVISMGLVMTLFARAGAAGHYQHRQRVPIHRHRGRVQQRYRLEPVRQHRPARGCGGC